MNTKANPNKPKQTQFYPPSPSTVFYAKRTQFSLFYAKKQGFREKTNPIEPKTNPISPTAIPIEIFLAQSYYTAYETLY